MINKIPLPPNTDYHDIVYVMYFEFTPHSYNIYVNKQQ